MFTSAPDIHLFTFTARHTATQAFAQQIQTQSFFADSVWAKEIAEVIGKFISNSGESQIQKHT